MRLLLVSDTHGKTEKLAGLLETYKNSVAYVCHMGDYSSDLSRFEKKYPNLKMVYVNGNTDYAFYGQVEETISVEPKEGTLKKILVVHGHKFGVKTSYDRLLYYAKEKQVHGVFFGHTHKAACFLQDGVFCMNPGSLVFPVTGTGTYGLVSFTDDGEFVGEVLEYEQ